MALVSFATASTDGYGHGIAKSTYSASDPIGAFAFLSEYFPAHCQDLVTTCNESFHCGTSGRGALCTDEACTYPEGPPANFGIHTVNTSARPFGSLDNSDVEKLFTAKLRQAFERGAYDAFMDFSTVLYAVSLDQFIARFEADDVPFLSLAWHDDEGSRWYSLLVQVATSQLVLELVSPSQPTSTTLRIVEDGLQRLPSALLRGPAVQGATPRVLRALAVSKAASDLAAIQRFYVEDLLASVNHSHRHGGVTLQSYALPGADAQVRFVHRPASATLGDFTVARLEAAKHAAHAMAMVDEFCGVDKWIDNHFAYDHFEVKLDAYKANFDAHGHKYHIFGDCTPQEVGPGTNIYVVDPTGDSVQLNGYWENCPEGGAGDALQNACGQGNCTRHEPLASCLAELDSLCSDVFQLDDTCTDCTYRQWASLISAGCTNADAINYCVSATHVKSRVFTI